MKEENLEDNGIHINAGYKIGIINTLDKGDGKILPEAVSRGE